LRFELGLALAPISDLWDVVQLRNVDLAFHSFGARGGDALYLWDGQHGLIVANSSKKNNPLRVRFSVAHELGHHEMHRSPNTRFLVADKNIDDEGDDLEREANAFAAVLLAPDRALQQDVESSGAIDIVGVVKMMRRYGLSYAALLNRLYDSQCITGAQRTSLKASQDRVNEVMRGLGFDPRKTFPVPTEQVPPEFVSDVLALHGRGTIGAERVAELLRVSETRAREVAKGRVGGNDAGEMTHTALKRLDNLLRD
jgi:Zn-dependent peptidase ImmA (M78 family)